MNQNTILFIYTAYSTFVKNDDSILSRFSLVKKHRYRQGKSLRRHLKSQFRLAGWLLKNIRSANFIYCWFADYHSFLPALFAKIFGKKFYLVLGGYDVTYIPELNYGSHKNALRSFCATFSVRHAAKNLAVSDYVRKMALERVPEADVMTLYNGVDVKIGTADLHAKKDPRLILTVGSANTQQRIRLKGIDLFCAAARQLPDYRFTAIGISEGARQFLEPIPKNLAIIDKMSFEKLVRFYQTATVYCQFSLIESFGMTVAEAMLFGCVPVATAVGALPEVVGNTGYLIEKPSVEKAVAAIKKVMSATGKSGEKAGERVAASFSLARRENALKALFSK